MAQKREPDHCRLFFILARNADMGVIFRRGPSKWVQIIRWDTAHDTFEPGQWFHGRIYEKRCDLSPDGTLMIYFAQKINRRTIADKDYTYAWTAISRPPYLTALALWPKGDCWHGGGLFETERRVWLNHWPFQAVAHPDHQPHGLEVKANPNAYGEDFPVLFRRLERDGWTRKQELKLKEEGLRVITDSPLICEKPCPQRPCTLVMACSVVNFARRFDFVVRHRRGKTFLNGATWADWDRQGRLVFVRAGKLFASNVDESGELYEQELADFDSARPHLKPAPDWARHW